MKFFKPDKKVSQQRTRTIRRINIRVHASLRRLSLDTKKHQKNKNFINYYFSD